LNYGKKGGEQTVAVAVAVGVGVGKRKVVITNRG
jgi:hypothetical protein